MSMTPAQQEVWAEATDPAQRELIFDFLVSRAFRRDVFVRGLRRIPREPAVKALSFASASLEPGILSVNAQAGTAELPKLASEAVRDALAVRPHTVGELLSLPGCGDMTPEELTAVLMGSDLAVPLWQALDDGTESTCALSTARRFNAVAAAQLAPWGIGAGQFGLASPAPGCSLTAWYR